MYSIYSGDSIFFNNKRLTLGASCKSHRRKVLLICQLGSKQSMVTLSYFRGP